MIRFTEQNHLLQLLTKKVIAPAEKLIEKRQKRLDEIFEEKPELVIRHRRRTQPAEASEMRHDLLD
jgi:hypothetical protein